MNPIARPGAECAPQALRPLLVFACLLACSAAPDPVRAQNAPLTLRGAAEAALATDPGLAASEARQQGARADIAQATAGRLPTLQLDGSLVRFQEPMVVAPLHSFDPSSPPRFDETLVQGAARVRYTAFDGGATSARVGAARSGETAARAGTELRRLEVLERVSAAYLGVLTARATEEAAGRRLAALLAEEARARQRVDAGSAAEVEALRAAAALQEARADSAGTRSGTDLAERSLARVMGVPPSDMLGRPLAEVGLAPTPTAVEARVTETHPDLVRAREVERAAERRLDERRAGRLPRLDLSAGLLDYGTASGNHVAEWQAGLSVSWPLFTGGARNAAIRRAEADVEAAREEREVARRALGASEDAARAELAGSDARVEALAASVTQWEEVARIEALALATGAGVQSDLLSAEASLFRARAGLARARYERLLARVRLARASGALDLEWLERTLEVGR